MAAVARYGLEHAMLHDPLVILDFETTGLHPERGDRITEIGLVRVEAGRITDRYSSLANAGTRISASIQAYTGITQRMVDEAPPVEQVLREAIAFIGDSSVVAHSAIFDQRFLVRECRRARLGLVLEPVLCSMKLARRLYPLLPGHSLTDLARGLKLPSTELAHRAGVDAELTAHLVLRVLHDVAAWTDGQPVTARLLRRLIQLPAAEVPVELEQLRSTTQRLRA
jgi:DNA polymerase III subunit epsilon